MMLYYQLKNIHSLRSKIFQIKESKDKNNFSSKKLWKRSHQFYELKLSVLKNNSDPNLLLFLKLKLKL